MPDDVTMAIVTALAAKAAEMTADGVKTAISALLRVIRVRFGSGTPEAAALDSAMAHPDDRAGQIELADALARTMAADQDFDMQVRAGWRAVVDEISADRGGVVNQFSGHAGNVLQARDIAGDVRFGQ